jgi:hypothetical protein
MGSKEGRKRRGKELAKARYAHPNIMKNDRARAIDSHTLFFFIVHLTISCILTNAWGSSQESGSASTALVFRRHQSE